jgi:uncharacterized iron-regulated membrane protein
MTFIWLVAWLISHTPQVQMFGAWNNWGIALTVCLAIDLIGSLGADAWRRRPLRALRVEDDPPPCSPPHS